ncbi:Protein of unknown function, partial [Gryllus bimaculatus]
FKRRAARGGRIRGATLQRSVLRPVQAEVEAEGSAALDTSPHTLRPRSNQLLGARPRQRPAMDFRRRTEAKATVDAEAETEAEANAKAMAKAKVERKAEAKVEAKAEPKAKVKAEVKAEVETKADANAEAEAEQQYQWRWRRQRLWWLWQR